MPKSKSQKVASKASKASEEKDHNPFERRKNEPHFKIFGRKTQQTEQKVGQSRARAMEKRKKTLLIAMKQGSKANKFLDNRIGERNASMTQEERDLLRYQKEIQVVLVRDSTYIDQKRFKSNPFSLEDNEDVELLDSSLGNAIKNDYMPSDHEEDEDDALDAKDTAALNFGGFGEETNGQSHPKTRKEIMEEIIAKSKLRKHEKAKEKEQQEELMSQLDNDFLAIAGLLGTKNNKKEQPANVEHDEYDLLVKELAFDTRSAPTNRLKTPEEILKEEKEKLQKLDQERLKRMKGEDAEELDPKRPKFQSADALEDDFIPDDKYKTFGPVQDEDEEKEEEEQVEDSDEDVQDVVIKRKPHDKEIQANGTDDIPFTFDMPASYDDFLELLGNRDLEQQKIIIHRIRVCNQVGQGNKAKMEQFFEILLQHLQQLSGEFPINFGYLNYITKLMYEAAKMSSQHATKVMQKKVKSMMKNLQNQDKSNFSWPSTQELLVLKLLGVLFTTSDFQHPVITPAMLYMAYCLTNLPVRTGEEATKGLFICNLFYNYLSLSKRYSPESIRFLLGLLTSLEDDSTNVHFSTSILRIKSKKPSNNTPNKIQFSQLNNSDLAYFGTDQFRIDALQNIVSLISKFMHLYSHEPAFEVVYSTILPTLKSTLNNIPAAVKKSLEELISFLEKTSEAFIRVRQPMLLQRKQVAQVKSLVPRFEEDFAVGVDYDPNVKRAEKKRLERTFKREKKGAIRELRKDNSFIQQEKFKQMRADDNVRKQKERKIMAELEQQEAQYKQAMRMKAAQKLKKKKSAF